MAGPRRGFPVGPAGHTRARDASGRAPASAARARTGGRRGRHRPRRGGGWGPAGAGFGRRASPCCGTREWTRWARGVVLALEELAGDRGQTKGTRVEKRVVFPSDAALSRWSRWRGGRRGRSLGLRRGVSRPLDGSRGLAGRRAGKERGQGAQRQGASHTGRRERPRWRPRGPRLRVARCGPRTLTFPRAAAVPRGGVIYVVGLMELPPSGA